MTEREKILGRIREALTVSAPRPGHHGGAQLAHAPAPSSAQTRQWLPAVGDTFEQQLAAFRENASALKADFQSVKNREELAALLLKLRNAEGWKKIGSHSGELTDDACRALALPVVRTDQPYSANELESCEAGISECDALIAQTGSITWCWREENNCSAICPPRSSC